PTSVRVSPDLEQRLQTAAADQLIPVIIQGGDQGTLMQAVQMVAGRDQLDHLRQLGLIHSLALELYPDQIQQLRTPHGVTALILDRDVAGSANEFNHTRATTGADQVIGTAGFSPIVGQFTSYVARMPSSGVNGTGIGIAVLDSGIYEGGGDHEDFRNLNDSRVRRILYHQNFVTGESGFVGPQAR